MNFTGSFCDPFQKEIINLGIIESDKIIATFQNINWKDYLERISVTDLDKIFYSPSLEIENPENKNGLQISAIDDPGEIEFYIFYKRPKKLKTIDGTSEKMDEGFITDVTGQTGQDVLDCLNALLKNDLEFLEQKIK